MLTFHCDDIHVVVANVVCQHNIRLLDCPKTPYTHLKARQTCTLLS